jgi:hypothetical protein
MWKLVLLSSIVFILAFLGTANAIPVNVIQDGGFDSYYGIADNQISPFALNKSTYWNHFYPTAYISCNSSGSTIAGDYWVPCAIATANFYKGFSLTNCTGEGMPTNTCIFVGVQWAYTGGATWLALVGQKFTALSSIGHLDAYWQGQNGYNSMVCINESCMISGTFGHLIQNFTGLVAGNEYYLYLGMGSGIGTVYDNVNLTFDVPCNCSSWSNTTCYNSTHRGQTRTCNFEECNTTQYVIDSSCSPSSCEFCHWSDYSTGHVANYFTRTMCAMVNALICQPILLVMLILLMIGLYYYRRISKK